MPRRRAFTLVELMVVIGIIALLMAMLLPAVQAIREAARRTRCQNNLRQIGIAIMAHLDAKHDFPAGWKANDPGSDRPGWSWAVQVLPYLNEAHPDINLSTSLDLPAYEPLRRQSLPIFLCPSDGAAALVTFLPATSTPGVRPALGRSTMAVSLPTVPSSLLTVARSNYAGVFGTKSIDDGPDFGNGVFFRKSHVRFEEVNRGRTKTAMVGERSSRTGAATWVGVIPGADRAMARVVGTSEQLPNDVLGDVPNFSSEHGPVTNFLLVNAGVKVITDDIDPAVFRAMSTRDGLGGQPAGQGIPSPPPAAGGASGDGGDSGNDSSSGG
jgi:prepilin-type N-terminal cleavage/methylation domain-containing protein